jgi:hypothetical protein
VLSYPSAMSVSTRALTTVTDLLRRHRAQRATRWRKLTVGRQALLVVAYLRKGETYTDLAGGFEIGTSTVYRYIREAIGLLAAMAPTLEQAIAVARRKAFVNLDGTLLRIRPRWDQLGPRPPVLLRQTQAPRGERAGHRRPGRTARVDLAHPARGAARHGSRPRARDHRRPHHRRRDRGGRHRLPGRAAAPRCGCRSADAASTPTPAAIGASPRARRRSTPRTPVCAARASGPTPS